MAQIRKAEGQVEIKCHADKFYDVWARKPHQVMKMSPNKCPKVELHQGHNWHTVGSVISWDYVFCGKSEMIKTKVEEIDENGRSVRYKAVDGNMMNSFYKNLIPKIQVIPKAENSCIVKWEFEYEKMTEDAPDANVYLDFLLGIARDMGAHLCLV